MSIRVIYLISTLILFIDNLFFFNRKLKKMLDIGWNMNIIEKMKVYLKESNSSFQKSNVALYI